MTVPSPRLNRKARIEIIPLIDVMFFLLATFVMVSLSMIRNQGIEVHLPAMQTGTPQKQKDSATITVTDKGKIYFDKDEVDSTILKSRLLAFKIQVHDPKIFINGDAKVSLGDFLSVIDEVREAGIMKVGIHTKPKLEVGISEKPLGK